MGVCDIDLHSQLSVSLLPSLAPTLARALAYRPVRVRVFMDALVRGSARRWVIAKVGDVANERHGI